MASSASLTYLASRSASEPGCPFLCRRAGRAGDFSPVGDQYFLNMGLSAAQSPRALSNARVICGLACGKSTALGNQYLEHKQSGRPTRGSTPATARMRPMTHSMMNNAWPYSTASPLPQRICFTVPATSVSISLRIFMASMMHTVWPALTVLPTSTNGAAPGLLAGKTFQPSATSPHAPKVQAAQLRLQPYCHWQQPADCKNLHPPEQSAQIAGRAYAAWEAPHR